VSEIQVEDANAALRGVATDDAGKTYVIDAGNSSLRVFDSKDKVERVVSEGLDDPRDVTVANGKVYVLDKNGIVVFDQKTLAPAGKKAGGLFRDAKSIAVFGDRLYVGDFGNGQVQVLLASDFSVDKVIKDNLIKPWGVTVDKKSGDIYVADPGAVAVLHFDKDGQFIERFDPITISGFISPRSVIMHGDMLYVADYDRILGFKKGVLTIRPTLKID
jgi:DNA-binding beta-propeller fold protein YncE